MNPATGVSSQFVTLSPLKRDGSTVGQRATYEELVAALERIRGLIPEDVWSAPLIAREALLKVST